MVANHPNFPPPPPLPRDPAPRLMRGPARITDRQVEIMTATVCDVIANRKYSKAHPDESVDALIGVLVAAVRSLNAEVEAESGRQSGAAPVNPRAPEDAGLIPPTALEAQRRAESTDEYHEYLRRLMAGIFERRAT
ncbi:hypothetical protein [Burkholderia gladioli]|uniref:hypothetical protein n=1 Tax=Burkholderia gladioli TaxID=28095 RepID=UPI00163E8DEB|nr:hypothetical protein [Burkholderia gladioli]